MGDKSEQKQSGRNKGQHLEATVICMRDDLNKYRAVGKTAGAAALYAFHYFTSAQNFNMIKGEKFPPVPLKRSDKELYRLMLSKFA